MAYDEALAERIRPIIAARAEDAGEALEADDALTRRVNAGADYALSRPPT